MVIKHIVISGGGPTGFITYGAAKHLAKEAFWKLDDIESIYGCSIGAYMGVILSLGYDWDWLDDYFIKRPWDKVIGITPISIFDSLITRGIIGEKFIKDSLEPLLTAKELSINITLKELYEFNGIDIHIYSTNINTENIEKVDISYKTHPDLSLIKSICMSTAFPVMFQPIIDNKNGCYIDGGILNIFPLNDCLKQKDCDENEILAFKNVWIDEETNVTNESTMMEYISIMLRKIQKYICTEDKQPIIKNTVRCLIKNLTNVKSWMNAMSTPEMRLQLIETGIQQAKIFIDYIATTDNINNNNNNINNNNNDNEIELSLEFYSDVLTN
jgi:predicted acylesterase/phospholipase RssA